MKWTLSLLFVLVISASAFAQNVAVLSNEGIVEMIKAGIPASVIITKIHTSVCKFDTDTPALKSLNESGVPESVVSAMIEAAASPTSALPAADIRKAKPLRSAQPFTPYSALSKDEKKARRKTQMRVEIGAPANEVIEILVSLGQSINYEVLNRTSNSLAMVKHLKGFGVEMAAAMAGGDKPEYELEFSLSEVDGVTTVSLSAWLSVENGFGKKRRNSVDGNDKDRSGLEDMLSIAKARAERNQ